MEKRNGKVAIAIVAMFVVALSIVGVTYAYFVASVTQNSNTESVKVQAGILEVEYVRGGQITANNLVPGWESDGAHYYDPVYSVTNDSGTLKVTAITTTQHATKSNCTEETPGDGTCDPGEDDGITDPAKFSVTTSSRNTGTSTYVVTMKDVTNTLAAADKTNMTWELYSNSTNATTGGTLVASGKVPDTQANGAYLVLSDVRSISGQGTTQYYYLMLKYANNGDQSASQSVDIDDNSSQNHYLAKVLATVKILGVATNDGGTTYVDENGVTVTPCNSLEANATGTTAPTCTLSSNQGA